ncbi:MAG: type II and III secretion system protein family protein [Caulobacterales bacterium]|nr:type II and III secretion system protein family protein [Caulobacterales bacterium]
MQTASKLARAALAAALILAAAPAVVTPAFGQTLASEPTLRRTIHVPRDKSLSFRLSSPASRIVVAQPDIAKVTGTSDTTFYVQGIDFGGTNLLVYGKGGQLAEVIDVRVGYDADGLQQELDAILPGEKIHVRAVGDRLLLEGEVSNAGVVKDAMAVAQQYAEATAVTSNLKARATQVILQVRVLETTRSHSQDLGASANIRGTFQDRPFSFISGSGLIGNDPPNGILNIQGRFGNTLIDAQLQALEAKGQVRTLARPNLVALSGEKATFLAGGEFPYPIPNGGVNAQVTIEFKTYGVKLDFVPEMLADGRIRLAVAPEVSQLDPGNSLRLSGFTVPALTTRRANTTVELKPGESLAIGGLLENDYLNSIKQFPVLGDIPVLSALFRSSRWKRNDSELVILVTPMVVTDADKAEAAKTLYPVGSVPSDAALQLLGKANPEPLIAPGAKK